MAIKGFGFTDSAGLVGYYTGSAIGQGVALQATMPEKGKILAVRLKLAKYASTAYPKIWGMIWARTAGTILSQSANYITPSNVYTNAANLVIYEITMPGTEIAAGTALWIGFAKDASGANLAPYWGVDESAAGYTWNRDDGSAATPQPFVSSQVNSSQAIWIEVYYKTGGEVKVFGSAFTSKPAKVWNGASWLAKPVKIWDGSSWKESNS